LLRFTPRDDASLRRRRGDDGQTVFADPFRRRIMVDPATSNAAFTAMALNCRASRAWGAGRFHDCLRNDVVFWKGVRPTKDFPPLRIDEIA
jgi:hypothetical protein